MSEDLEYILAPPPNRRLPPDTASPDGVKASGRVLIPPEAKGPSTAIFSSIPEIMPEAEFARLLGVDSATLRRMAADGVMVRAGKGLFDVNASLPPYIERLRNIAARHESNAAREGRGELCGNPPLTVDADQPSVARTSAIGMKTRFGLSGSRRGWNPRSA